MSEGIGCALFVVEDIPVMAAVVRKSIRTS